MLILLQTMRYLGPFPGGGDKDDNENSLPYVGVLLAKAIT